ncbi:hypothetical protein BDC45DRAFT_524892 [Circinella umbellata]|nr:hypothetical protein BDC45DRAFT_524892 [Circinella umbellata]
MKPPTDWISAVTKTSGFLSDAIARENIVDIHTAHTLVQTLPMFISRSPLSTIEYTYVVID